MVISRGEVREIKCVFLVIPRGGKKKWRSRYTGIYAFVTERGEGNRCYSWDTFTRTSRGEVGEINCGFLVISRGGRKSKTKYMFEGE